MTEYHVHVNAHEITTQLKQEIIDMGLREDPFINIEDSYAPPMHLSLETKNRGVAVSVWKTVLAATEKTPQFKGYIEYEILKDENRVQFDSCTVVGIKDNTELAFSIPKLELVAVPIGAHKSADLHVKIASTTPENWIDKKLEAIGFYKVETARNRIYTLQVEKLSDGQSIFDDLKVFFRGEIGIREINYEIVAGLVRFPKSFNVPKYLIANGYPSANI